MRYFMAFAIAAWIGMVASSALAIYGFGAFVKAYGAWSTFRTMLWYALVPAAMAGVGAAIGGMVAKRRGGRASREGLMLASLFFAFAVAAYLTVSELARVSMIGLLFYPFVFLGALFAALVAGRAPAKGRVA